METVVVWRTWVLCPPARLLSIAWKYEWNGPVVRAKCMRAVLPGFTDHDAPAAECSCGIWGLFNSPPIAEEREFLVEDGGYAPLHTRVVGLIRCVPPVIVGEEGVRCAGAVVERLFVPRKPPKHVSIELLERRYDCEVSTADSAVLEKWHETVLKSRKLLLRARRQLWER